MEEAAEGTEGGRRGRRRRIARHVSRDVAFDAAELARAELEDGVAARGTARRGCARKGDGERGRSIMAREPVPRLVGGRTGEERAPGREWDSIERATRVRRGRGRANQEGGRGQVYRGDLDASGPTNELFEALFDIRHDFIKHSSNVQTLYIELYLRPRGLLAPPFSAGPAALPPPPPSGPRRTDFGFARASTNIVHPAWLGRVSASAGAAYNENIVPRNVVMPQYRIMYNYITVKGRARTGEAAAGAADGGEETGNGTGNGNRR